MIPRRLLNIASAAALALGALTGGAVEPPAASAAQPNWTIDVESLPGTRDSAAETGPGNPALVGPNRAFLHRVSITNHGPSNIPALYLMHGPNPYPVRSVSPEAPTCSAQPLDCSLGTLAAGSTVVVDVVYDAPASGAFSVDYVATTVGASEQGGNSRGYSLPATEYMAVDASGDFDASYLVDGLSTVATNETLSASNPHSTRMTAPDWAVGARVADLATGPCPVASCIGQASELKLYGPAASANPPTFKVVVRFGPSEIPRGVSQQSLRLFHFPDVGPGYEIPRCGRTLVAPCGTVIKLRDGTLEATVWLTNNGVIRGWS